MIFLAVLLQKLEHSCKIGAFSAAIFRKALYRKWLRQALRNSIMHYLRISCQQGGVEPQY